jgi:hypothetical protein
MRNLTAKLGSVPARRVLPLTLALALFAVAGPTQALALPPAGRAATPPVVVANLGRHLVGINLESGASVQCSAQGQLLDTNGNGLADSLRGRAACLENRGVARLRLYYSQVQTVFADTWAPALTNPTDVVSDTQPAYVVSYTPASRFCPPPGDFDLTYRVQQAIGIRSLDGSLATFTIRSNQFQTRAVDAAQNGVC